jgi:hypothetical protein
MPFRCETYQVLIASPSDLPEERQTATDAINEWNALNAAVEGVTLLPVKWETHAVPETGIPPQAAINAQLVDECDILLGLFWTKLGTPTGVAESGTVEEIERVVSVGKPAMLYFSRRPIDPMRIDRGQHDRLREFQAETYATALTGTFDTLDRLHHTLQIDLTRQLRKMRSGRARAGRRNRLDEAIKLTELIRSHREHQITPEQYEEYERRFLAPPKRTASTPTDPLSPRDKGPNGYRIGYTVEGDKVEWLPDDENPGEEWPMILRRNDNAIREAENEFTDVIWYDRKLVLQQKLNEGTDTIDPEIEKGMLAAMRRVERKYGKRKLRNYYHDDYEWGMLNGKLSALRWVMGDDWDMLDT